MYLSCFRRRNELSRTLPILRWDSWVDCGPSVVLIWPLQVSVIEVVVVDCLLAEEGLMWQAVHTNVFRMGDGEGVRDVGPERGWKCEPVETEVDFRVEVKARVRSGVKSQAPHCGMSGEVTVDKDCGADNLRRKVVENGAGKPEDVG